MKKDNCVPNSSIYLMHKYWGKKPGQELRRIVTAYSGENEVVFDPFAGYGGIGVECLLNNRNVILNDLNPSAVFISQNIMQEKIDVNKLERLFREIKEAYCTVELEWYTHNNNQIVTILRSNDDVPRKLRVIDSETKKVSEVLLTPDEIEEFKKKEDEYIIDTWYPQNKLIVNSRISAKEGMRVCDLFPKRALICQSYLFDLINRLEPSPEKELIKLAFTSNTANCSKLVPPIKSRGDMAQGAWMTGFYIGETYLENNVFHYFENRMAKVIKGKKDYLKLLSLCGSRTEYKILNEDSKSLSLKDRSVDLVFTDFPYGDTVPYFEQSQIWNAWLQKTVDYENEIVISNSVERNKDFNKFKTDIGIAISEISRILKDDSFFVFTFHSLYGKEWTAIVDALNCNGFDFVKCDVLLQKTLPPRQLTRKNAIKGDIVAVYRKGKQSGCKKKIEFHDLLTSKIKSSTQQKDCFDTNDIILLCIQSMLEIGYANKEFDFHELIHRYFYVDTNVKMWRVKDELL